MLEMGTSGSMSGDGKQNASRVTAPILDSTGKSLRAIDQRLRDCHTRNYEDGGKQSGEGDSRQPASRAEQLLQPVVCGTTGNAMVSPQPTTTVKGLKTRKRTTTDRTKPT
jgi:hypothetical protein